MIGKPERFPAPYKVDFFFFIVSFLFIQVQVTEPESTYPGLPCVCLQLLFYIFSTFNDAKWKMKTVVQSIDFIYPW